MMWFDSADPQDLTLLASYDLWGGVPARPVRLPGLGRYGRYELDKRLLLTRCDLTIAEKRELIFLSQHVHKLDHFEFLSVPQEASAYHDPRAIKKAYFKLSQLTHPDSLRGRALGPFEEAAQVVYEYASYAYELLSQDEAFCGAYARVTAARDLAFMATLEQERAALRAAAASAPSPPHHPHPPHAHHPHHPHLGRAVTPVEDPAVVEQRKEALRARLAHNQARHQSARGAHSPQRANPAGAQQGLAGQPNNARAQASRFFQAGVIAEKRKQWVSARGHFKLAVQYAPEVSEYQEALERTSRRVDAERADELWAQALEVDEAARAKQLKLSKWLEVVSPLFEQSLELAESVDRVKTYALRCVELGDHERAEPWLRRSIDEHPFAIDLKWVLLQSLEARAQLEAAHAQCDAILALDPSEPRALAWRKRHAR